MKRLHAVFATGALLAGTALAGERTEDGRTLVVPEAVAAQGTVYYVLPGLDAQVTFVSDAPLEHIKGTNNQVIGYVVAGENGAPVAGDFHLPVSDFDTGIPMRNEHLQGERWMHAASFPDVRFDLSGVEGMEKVKEAEGFTTYSATLVGEMTVKGVTKPMRIPARLTMMPASERTSVRAKGDLMAIRCEYTILMSDFGVGANDPAMKSGKLSDELEMDTFLLLSTVAPADQRR